MKKILAIVLSLAACLSMTACSSVSESNMFDGLELFNPSEMNRIVFNDLESLEEFSDIAVVGTFIDDAVQSDGYSLITSFNTIEVTKVLFGDVSVGDTLKIGQYYGIDGDRLVTYSDLTPMQKGDEWVFFLVYADYLEDSYWCSGDSDGRYPVPNSDNQVIALTEYSDLGVYYKSDFKSGIYNEILEKYDV